MCTRVCKQVNVTTVTTVTTCVLVSWCILDFCVFNSSDYVQTVFYATTVTIGQKLVSGTRRQWLRS